jgi:tetratricopeptide (TPR) repeat protein
MRRSEVHIVCTVGTALIMITSALAETAPELNAQGNRAYKEGNYEQAIDSYSRSLSIDPRYKKAMFNRGLAYYRTERLQLALSDFVRVLEMDPSHHRTMNFLGLIALKQGEPDVAFAYFREAAKLHGRSSYFLNAALAAHEKGYLDVATAYARAALERDMNNKKASALLARCAAAQRLAQRQRQKREALEEARKRLEAKIMAEAEKRWWSYSAGIKTNSGGGAKRVYRKVIRRRG